VVLASYLLLVESAHRFGGAAYRAGLTEVSICSYLLRY
jgi:hypothetical protein